MIARALLRLSANLRLREYQGGNERYLVFTWLGAGAYLHRWRAPETGMHSHPWRISFSILLSGQYTEKRMRVGDDSVRERVVKAPAIVVLRDRDFHDVSVEPGAECWSLFFHPRATRVWHWLKEFRIDRKVPGSIILSPAENQTGEAADGTQWEDVRTRNQIERNRKYRIELAELDAFSRAEAACIKQSLQDLAKARCARVDLAGESVAGGLRNRDVGSVLLDEQDNFPVDPDAANPFLCRRKRVERSPLLAGHLQLVHSRDEVAQ